MFTRLLVGAIGAVLGFMAGADAQTEDDRPQPNIVVIIDDGSFVPGVNPPTGIGDCWDATNQVTRYKEAKLNYECEGTIPCKPNYTCYFGPPSQQGCRYYKTHASIPVGYCETAQSNYCHECPPGSEIFCMIYKMYEGELNGVCVGACNEWQVWFDGRCTD